MEHIKFHMIGDEVAVGPLPKTDDDIQFLYEQGFRTIINVAESGRERQVAKQEESAMRNHGFEFAEVDVSRKLEVSDFEEFYHSASQVPHPIYVHSENSDLARALATGYVACEKQWSVEYALSKTAGPSEHWGASWFKGPIKRFLAHKSYSSRQSQGLG